MPKKLTLNLPDAVYDALSQAFDNDQDIQGQKVAASIEEYCANLFLSAARGPLERFPTPDMKAARRAHMKAQQDLESAFKPTVTVSIT